VKRASNDTLAGRRYLDLQREAKRTGRPTDEFIQLYALECFLDRLVHSKFAGTANTRWRDFVDIYVLTGRFAIKAQALKSSMQRVAQFRNAELALLRTALDGYAAIAQTRWRAWLRKQHLDNSIPTDFSIVLERVVSFADPLIVQGGVQGDWHPIQGRWI